MINLTDSPRHCSTNLRSVCDVGEVRPDKVHVLLELVDDALDVLGDSPAPLGPTPHTHAALDLAGSLLYVIYHLSDKGNRCD